MNRHEAIPARADADELPAALGSREPSGASTQVWLPEGRRKDDGVLTCEYRLGLL